MPIYSYLCQKCKKEFEYFARSISNPGKPICECGSKDVEKMFNTMADVHYKGKGFYTNDYSNGKKRIEELSND
jgi:putative FmdB family regulatory protein